MLGGSSFRELRLSYAFFTRFWIFRNAVERRKHSGRNSQKDFGTPTKVQVSATLPNACADYVNGPNAIPNRKAFTNDLEGMRAKLKQFQVAYDYSNAARTSNMVDRLMNYQDRLLRTMQYFHGSTGCCSIVLEVYGVDLEFSPLWKENKCQKIQSGVLPSKISTDFNTMTTGYRIS